MSGGIGPADCLRDLWELFASKPKAHLDWALAELGYLEVGKGLSRFIVRTEQAQREAEALATNRVD